ncbi:hypothetical protein HJC23_000886 [Cyclotella cryptica]|uniref:Uncharacterized protein n=1 Tax=Cyclotella cryptica TaxID=29204 RepID=A0ABD3PUB5_9STRA
MKHHRKEVEETVEQAQLALKEAQAELMREQKADAAVFVENTPEKPSNRTAYPYPFEAVSSKSKVILQPRFGSHRPSKNAVFAFAEGYGLEVYVTFVESLKLTGYDGDVVFAVSSEEDMKPDVADYLKYYDNSDSNGLNVISYALPWECYTKGGERILSTNNKGRGSTTNNGFSDCQVHGIYSTEDGVSPAKDPRIARPVATARYEMYWIWSRQYEATSHVLILDVRDSYFQSNPFEFEQSTISSDSCRLDLFEENREAVNIGKSSYNSKWIKSAYGKDAFESMAEKPVICSGSSMGSKNAIELYSTAMVAQFDKTKCKQVGCDQGFHNYLYYDPSARFNGVLVENGCQINVHKQGDGAVNNLAAMRNTSLRSQGVLITRNLTGNDGDTVIEKQVKFDDDSVVVNQEGSTLSPVMHQFDRDKELKLIIRKRTQLLTKLWQVSRTKT